MHNRLSKPALSELVASFMATLEHRLMLEAKYPDWHEDADDEFEQQEFEQNHIAHQIADRLAAVMHPDRHAKVVAADNAACDARIAASNSPLGKLIATAFYGREAA